MFGKRNKIRVPPPNNATSIEGFLLRVSYHTLLHSPLSILMIFHNKVPRCVDPNHHFCQAQEILVFLYHFYYGFFIIYSRIMKGLFKSIIGCSWIGGHIILSIDKSESIRRLMGRITCMTPSLVICLYPKRTRVQWREVTFIHYICVGL